MGLDKDTKIKDLLCFNCKHNGKESCKNKDLRKTMNIVICGRFEKIEEDAKIKDTCLLRRDYIKEDCSVYYASECREFLNDHEDRYSVGQTGFEDFKYCPYCGKKIEVDKDNWDSLSSNWEDNNA